MFKNINTFFFGPAIRQQLPLICTFECKWPGIYLVFTTEITQRATLTFLITEEVHTTAKIVAMT